MKCINRQDILKTLINSGIINERRVLQDDKVALFDQVNLELSQQLESKLGLDFNGKNLLEVKEIKKNALRGHAYYRNNVLTFYRVEVNNELMEIVENATENNEVDYEPIDLYELESSEGLVPQYEQYIQYKENLIKRLETRLSKVKADKRKFSSDNTLLKYYTKLESDIENRLNGDSELNIIGLKEELSQLLDKPPIEKISFYAEKDLERLDYLSKSENFEDLNEAKEIITFYKASGDFSKNNTNPFFNIEDIYEGKEIILPTEVINVLTNLKDKVIKYEVELENKQKKVVVDFINSNKKVQKTFGKKLTYETLFFNEKGLKDASWVDMFLMDVTNGILSHNGIVPQVGMNTLQNIWGGKLVFSKEIEGRISEIQNDVEKELSNLGYSINVPGVKGVSYELFRSKDKNGLFQDSITQRYSSTFFEERKKMSYEFDMKISEANKEENPSVKSLKFKEAFNFKKNWFKKNTFVLDITKIPEIYQDSKLSLLKENYVLDNDYINNLKEVLGEQGYIEEVNKQIKLLKDYIAAEEVAQDNIIVKEGVDNFENLSDVGKRDFEIWKKRNNPYIFLQNYNNNTPIKQGNLELNPNMSFNYSIPKNKKVLLKLKDGKQIIEQTEESTNYYDERFKTIENSENLKEFHNIIMEVQNTIYDVMPPEMRKKFNAFSLGALKKQFTEIMLDKNLTLYEKLIKAAKELYDKIRGKFGLVENENFSQAPVDAITGIPQYKVNDGFIKSNKVEINRRYYIEEMRLKEALSLDLSKKFNKYETFDLDKLNQETINILAENLGVKPTKQAIKNRLPNEDYKNLELGKKLEEAVTHQVVENNSLDLPKILKLTTNLAMEYSARVESLPIIEMLKDHYTQIKTPATNNLGKNIVEKGSGKTRLEGERIKANKQMDSWFERVVLGNYGSKNEFGDTRFKRKAEVLNNTGIKAIDRFTSKLNTTVTGKILDTEEKIMKSKLENFEKILEEEISEEQNIEQKKQLEKTLETVLKKKNNLGKDFSAVSFFDALFNFIRFKGLGWNLSSSVTNFMEGQIANMTIAATGDYFTPENIYRANDIIKGSFAKNMSFGKFVTPGAKKARILMDRYDILQDASNELQKASAKSAFSSYRNLSPYELIRRVEYLNQTPLMIAVLLDKKVTGVNEEVSNVWDAMNPDGTLKDEFKTEENINNWEKRNGDAYNDFSSHMRKMIVNAHGDYDELRGMMASEYISGKAFLMFKRWMSRQIYQRWAKVPQADIEVGIKEYKGRYLSHTQASGFLHGSIIGFGGLAILGAGPLGAILGGTAGLIAGKFWGANTGMNFLQELSFIGKELFLNILRIPTNNLVGKDIIKNTDYNRLKQGSFTERDVRNLKANLVEMTVTLASIGMLLFTKALLWDDEEDEKRAAHNLLANRFMQLSSQAAMYIDPIDFHESTIGNLPLLKFFENVGKTAVEAQDFLEGKDIISAGPNAGESALYNQMERTFFPGIIKGQLGFESHASRQFKKSPFDSWFFGDEKRAKAEAKSIRAEYKKELMDNGLEGKELTKAVNKKYKPKKKGQSYVELLEQYQKE